MWLIVYLDRYLKLLSPNIFILTMIQMILCNVKCVTHLDKPIDKYHSTLHLSILNISLSNDMFYCQLF